MALENALDYEGLKHYDGKSKEYIEKKITELDSEKVDKTTVATSSTLGLVKSGTDITVDSSGNVSVNDNSHKHTVSNISDLTATASELNVLDGITATTTELNYVDGVTSNIQTQLNSKVPTSRKVNGKALSSDITLSASDVGADASGSANTALSDAKDYTDSAIEDEVTARNSAIDTAKSSAISTASTDATTKANNALASAKTYTDTKTANLASTSTVDDKISAHNTSTSAHSDIRGSISTLQTEVTTHKNASNPHGISKNTIGLGNVENKSSATIRSEITKDNVKSALGYTPAELDANGKVPSSQLPSYVDDTIEGYLYNGKFYKESAHTTVITGESGKIYVDLSNNKTYRWSGSAYVVISETLALGETSSTAYRGDRGKIAYDHSQSAHFSGNYNDLTNKPTIPTVGNGTITITQNGVSKGTFTTNQSGNTTIELTDTNTDTKYTLPSAGASLGGVKSGGDVTISGGVITVNDDSHNHVISNVDGLQSSLDSKASILSDMTKFPVNYGFAVARCGNTIGTSGGSDNYYMLADSSNDFRVGTQLNGASTVTWTKFSKDGHTHSDKLNKAVTVLGAMTDKTITDLQNSLDKWLKACYETPNTRATFTANPNFISLWNNSDTTNKISAGANWTVEVETYYNYHNYVLLKITTYSSKQVYYVEKSNGTWGKITKVSFDGETATTATALTSKSIGTTKQPVYFDANGKPVAISYTIEKSVPSNAVFTDTNTHYTTGITAGASGTTSNAAASNPYIKIKDDSTHRGQIQLKGGGATTVSSDANGVITISSTDTNTDTKVTSVGNHYTPSADSNATLSADASSTTAATWNSTSLVTGVNLQRDAKGHVTGVTVDSIKMPANPNSDTNTAHSHSAGVGLVGSGNAGTSGTYTYKAKLRSETALTVDSAAATTTSGKVYPVAVDKSGYLAVNVPWTDTNTDTHYTTGLKVGASAKATANAAATNGSVYLNLLDNTTIRDSHKIVGSGSVSVTSDANGVITIKGTDTNDKYTHPNSGVTAGTYRSVTVNAQGHVTAGSNPTLTVAQGGTGATTLTSGAALIGNGTGAVTTRAITDMTSKGHITYNTNLMTTNTLAYWNGSFTDKGASNLAYCNQGAFGKAATKGVDTTATSGSENLITSGAMYTALANKLNKDDALQTPLKIADDAGVVKYPITLYNPTPDSPCIYGSELVISTAGNTFIGSGGSPTALRIHLSSIIEEDEVVPIDKSTYASNYEQMYITSDSNLWFYSNCDTIADRKGILFNKYGELLPLHGLSYNIGRNDVNYTWNKVYANNFNSPKVTQTWLAGNQGEALINSTAVGGSFVTLDKLNSTNGYFCDSVNKNTRYLTYTAKETVDAGTNGITYSAILLNEEGNTSFPGDLYAKRFKGDGVKNLTSKTNLGVVSLTDDGLMIPTIGTLTWWNGQWKDGYSNLMYCNKGAFGDAVTRGVDEIIPLNNSDNLITSGAMYTALAGKLGKSDAAASATQVYNTLTNPTTSTNHYIPFHTGGSTSGNKSLLYNDGLFYKCKQGTASTAGAGILVLGNNIVEGTDGNKYGSIIMWARKSAYCSQIYVNTLTDNRLVAMPDAAGTLSVSSSDARLKDNIKDTEENALSLVNSIKFRQFDWIESGEHQKIGVVADELEELDKHLVLKGTGGYYDDDENGNPVMNVKCVDTFYLMGYYGKAIQELSTENVALREEVNALKSEMAELKELVSKIINNK